MTTLLGVSERQLTEQPLTLQDQPLRAKRILVPMRHGFEIRYVLNYGIAERLLAMGANLILMTPVADDEGFRALHQRPGIEFQCWELRRTRAERMAYHFRMLWLEDDRLCIDVPRRRERFVFQRGAVARLALLPASGLSHLAFLRRAYRRLENALFPARYLDSVLRACQADVILLPSTGFGDMDTHLMRSARRLRIPIVALGMSWDHLSVKGSMTMRADRLIVWGQPMKDDAVRLHGYRPEQVFMAGSPQFDLYAQRATFRGREQVLEEFGLDPQARLILYGASPESIYADHYKLAQLLVSIANNTSDTPFNLLIRLHPRQLAFPREMAAYDELTSDRVKLWKPELAPGEVWGNVSTTDSRLLAEVINAADIVVHIYSSLVLDASALDTPNICIDFDISNVPETASIRRARRASHYRPCIELGATRLAESPSHLIELVSSYLKNPSLDSWGRSEILKLVCNDDIGRSAEKIADLVRRFTLELSGKGERVGAEVARGA